MNNSEPIFKKITLIVKEENNKDKYFNNTFKVEYNDCGMVITGDFLIITEYINEEQSEKSKIYELKFIDSYKLYKN